MSDEEIRRQAQTMLYNKLVNNASNNAARNTANSVAVNKATNNEPNILETLWAGIQKPFQDVGHTVGGMIGTGVASIKDLIEGTTGDIAGYKNGTSQWAEGKNTDAFKKDWYGEDDIKDVYKKATGESLNAAADLATLAIPAAAGAGSVATKAATSVGGNALAGAVGGAGDELMYNKDATAEDILKRAAVGGATGAAVGGLNKGLNNAIASGTTNKLLNNKLTNSVIGRGALSGAAGGALGGGGTVLTNGGDLGEAANAALLGAGAGALSGATTAATTQALSKVGSAARNKLWDSQSNRLGTDIYSGEALANDDANSNWDKLAQEGGYENWKTLEQSFLNANPDYEATGSDTSAVLGWMDANPGDYDPNATVLKVGEPTAKIQKKNKLQKIGQELQRDSQEITNQGLLDSLDEKTATRAVQSGAIQKLADMGVNAQDYNDYAETSSYVNKTISDLAKKSGVMVEAPNLASELDYGNINTVMSDTAQKKYNGIVKQIVADGDSPSRYSASYLLEKSREIGNKAANLRGNTDDVNALRAGLTEAKYVLRDYANNALQNSNITGEGPSAAIAQGLQKMGANQKVVDYYTAPNADGTAPTAKDLIARSALFEQARDMGTQSSAEQYRRSASRLPQNATTAVIRSSGVDRPLKTVLSNTIAPLSGAATNAVGKGIEGVGNLVATPTALSQVDSPASTVLFNSIGRQVGRNEAQAEDYLANAAQEATTAPSVPSAGVNALEDLAAMPTNTNLYNQLYGANTDATSAGTANTNRNSYASETEYWADIIGRAATMALEEGDWDSFQELYSMYKGVAPSTTSSGSSQTKLTATQQRANAAMNSLGRLSQMTPDLGYNLSGIPVIGNIATLGGNDYEAEAKSLAQQIGYMVSGSNIKENEAENIGKSYVPQPWDSEQVRANKLRRAREIIQQYQNGYSDDALSGITSNYQQV